MTQSEQGIDATHYRRSSKKLEHVSAMRVHRKG